MTVTGPTVSFGSGGGGGPASVSFQTFSRLPESTASRVDVFLESRDGYLVLVVEYDGVGFDPEHAATRERGIGLLGMRERAGLIGAQFELESRSGKGASIFVRYAPAADIDGREP